MVSGSPAPHNRLPAALSDRERRRARRALLGSAAVSVALFVAYFAVPVPIEAVSDASLILLGGVVGLVLLLVWHVRSIVRSPYPRVRAAAALITTASVFLVLFATAYFAMSQTDPGGFSEPLSRLDSLYFTVTIFATVGFGDIVATTSLTRVAAMLQMVADVILVGAVARLMVVAARRGVERREHSGEENPA